MGPAEEGDRPTVADMMKSEGKLEDKWQLAVVDIA